MTRPELAPSWVARAGRTILPLGSVFALFVACIWLNQSGTHAEWERARDRVFGDPKAHVFEVLRYPFIFLYQRSGDEAMYYATGESILGRPYDRSALGAHSRGRAPARFEAPPPQNDGRLHAPWTEVALEYPPVFVPFIVAPALVASSFDGYDRLFGCLMGLCLAASIYFAVDVVRRAHASSRDLDSRWWLAVVLLLALGSLSIQRLDPIVALAMVASVHGAVRRSAPQLGFWGGIAGACKIVPVLVVPVILAADWETWRRRIPNLSGWVALGVAVGFAPMLAAGPHAIVDLLRYHGDRGLQVESTMAALLGAARYVVGGTQPGTLSYGSFNLDGAVPTVLATLTVPLTLAVTALLVLRERRAGQAIEERQRVERIACATLAATVALWLCSKVFSPQYLTWGIPLAIAIPARRGLIACLLLVVACAATQLFYRGYYDWVFQQHVVGLATLLFRQGVLALLLLYLMKGDRSPSALSPELAS
jgi:hypothetical protein